MNEWGQVFTLIISFLILFISGFSLFYVLISRQIDAGFSSLKSSVDSLDNRFLISTLVSEVRMLNFENNIKETNNRIDQIYLKIAP